MQQEEKKLSLDEIHAELLEQLRDITAVCKKHNISYNMMCGSLLGAVRHKGFIPWDDDVDLLMTREEFQKFREIYPKECDKRFELTYLDTWTPRVMNRDPEKAAAFTDFFILDPVPPTGTSSATSASDTSRPCPAAKLPPSPPQPTASSRIPKMTISTGAPTNSSAIGMICTAARSHSNNRC